MSNVSVGNMLIVLALTRNNLLNITSAASVRAHMVGTCLCITIYSVDLVFMFTDTIYFYSIVTHFVYCFYPFCVCSCLPALRRNAKFKVVAFVFDVLSSFN